jgi:hypothetical protein
MAGVSKAVHVSTVCWALLGLWCCMLFLPLVVAKVVTAAATARAYTLAPSWPVIACGLWCHAANRLCLKGVQRCTSCVHVLLPCATGRLEMGRLVLTQLARRRQASGPDGAPAFTLLREVQHSLPVTGVGVPASGRELGTCLSQHAPG